jgi:hypothetical protein
LIAETALAPADMPPKDNEKKVGDLIQDAKSSLASLLESDVVKSDQWFMRLSASGRSFSWETLTNDTKTNDAMIRGKVKGSTEPVSDLVLAFVGEVEWRAAKRLMAYMQYFRVDYATGLLCGSQLRSIPSGKFLAEGGFLIMGSCQNLWI